jgi:GNAT superfamily N-acetyltransferase
VILADLPPDLTFPPLPETEAALLFAFAAKRAALGPHITARWGWDEARQLVTHRSRFSEKPFRAIVRDGTAIGTLSLLDGGDHLRFGEFYLFPEHHGRGLGTRVLRHCLALADARRLPVRLEHLKWNPVGTLYRRHGFVVTGESEIHWFLERPPGASLPSTASR